ncbi:MAG: single-stranded-DNA-specific exonuclease RecJ, partial [Clostridiales bacterium]|nr:single-stranded-DNA-specific exonuclease RecJ [Candidatus Blautia equi]
MEKWVVSAKRADFQKIAQRFGIDPVTARLIRNREVVTEEEINLYLYGTIQDLPSPWLLKDMKKAVDILERKIQDNKSIRIIGDYDIDGVTATCILLKGFRRLGARVDTYIPDRIADGYGLHMPLIEKADQNGIDTIVTCDNGIAAIKEIEEAKRRGMTVIVTDHHEIPFEDKDDIREYHIPAADAVINAKQLDCTYPYKNICGAVAAWKLICALYERFGVPEYEKFDYLELAAMATVGDIMDLQGENRILVKEGLKKFPHTLNYGLQALMRANDLKDRITAYHIGFVLGPCINASGRLDTAARSLELLMAESPDRAAEIAGDLKALNESRKALTELGKEEAFRLVEETDLKNDRVLVVFPPDCHESLAGIIAGKVREKYNKPTFVLTRAEQGIKGSGRSIESYSMYEEMVKCSEYMTQFGGHPMAAGLSMKEEQIEGFRRKLNQVCTLTEDDLSPKITIDVPMPISYVNRKVIGELSLLEPFGKANTTPLFAQKDVQVVRGKVIGKNQNTARFQLLDSAGNCIDAIRFGDGPEFLKYAQEKGRISVTYYPEINSFMGRETLQVTV